jgi:hypothetical protein
MGRQDEEVFGEIDVHSLVVGLLANTEDVDMRFAILFMVLESSSLVTISFPSYVKVLSWLDMLSMTSNLRGV